MGMCTLLCGFIRCGRNRSTKTIVPISMKELNSPKSLNATESSGTRLMKAPTVVILPTTNGAAISLRLFLMSSS